MEKIYQILNYVAATGSFSASARENRVSYNTARSICDKFVSAGDCQPGARGLPDCKMQSSMAAYLEAMVLGNPFLCLEEMQDRLMTDLNLLPNKVPSVLVICRTLHEFNSSKHNSTNVSQERFTPYNLVRRRAFLQWRDRQDPAKLFFGDETKSLNDQRLFSEHHKKSHIQLKRSRSSSFHLCFRSLLAFSERHPFQRFLIGLPNNAVSILEATSRVLSDITRS